MATMETFDTLAAARRLREAGVDPGQAEAHAETIAMAVGSSEIVTKTYLRAELAELRATMERGQKQILFAIVAVGGLVVAAMKYL